VRVVVCESVLDLPTGMFEFPQGCAYGRRWLSR
jgi:hypothetical protein